MFLAHASPTPSSPGCNPVCPGQRWNSTVRWKCCCCLSGIQVFFDSLWAVERKWQLADVLFSGSVKRSYSDEFLNPMYFKELTLLTAVCKGGSICVKDEHWNKAWIFFPVNRHSVTSQVEPLLLNSCVFLKHRLYFQHMCKANHFFVGESCNFLRNEGGMRVP